MSYFTMGGLIEANRIKCKTSSTLNYFKKQTGFNWDWIRKRAGRSDFFIYLSNTQKNVYNIKNCEHAEQKIKDQ